MKGEKARVGQPGQDRLKVIAPLDIGEKASEDRLPLLLFFEPVPIGVGDFFERVLDVMVALDPEPDVGLLILGDIELFDLAADAAR